MRTKEEIRELFLEEMIKGNFNEEITINEGFPFKVQIAIACSKESLYNAQLVIYNGVAQDLSRDKSLMHPKYEIDSIEFDLSKIGLDLSQVSLSIYKFDFYEGVYKIIPIFDDSTINVEETNRILVDPKTLTEYRDKIMLLIVQKSLKENKEKYKLSKEFIEKFETHFNMFNYNHETDKNFYSFTEKELDFLDECYDKAWDANLKSYKYNDPIFGEIEFNGYHNFYDYYSIEVEPGKTHKTLGIPFKVFGNHAAIKLGTLKTE